MEITGGDRRRLFMRWHAGNADIEIISGGTIQAAGGYASAGIGGNWGDGATVTITGDAVIKNAVGGGTVQASAAVMARW